MRRSGVDVPWDRRWGSKPFRSLLLVVAFASSACSDVGDSSAVPTTDGQADDQTVTGDEAGVEASEANAAEDAPLAQSGSSTGSSGNPSSGSTGSAGNSSGESAGSSGSEASSGASSGSAGASGSAAAGASTTQGASGGMDATVSSGSTDASVEQSDSSEMDAAVVQTDAGDTGVGDSTPNDSPSSDGHADASDAGGSGGGSLLPCTSAGQTNCVECQSSASDACSTTEALFVQLDINAGTATMAGPSPSSGCYECLVTAGCIDAPKVHQTGLECDDLTGSFTSGGGTTGSASALCLDTLECEIGSTGQQCALDVTGLSYCYCGSAGGPASTCSAHGSSVNGACLTPIVNGFTFAATDAIDILASFTDSTPPSGTMPIQPSGFANSILSCASGNDCNQCLQ
jgi:hypothetical protein